MRNIRAVARRELGAYFLSPSAYAVTVSPLCTTGPGLGLGVFPQQVPQLVRGHVLAEFLQGVRRADMHHCTLEGQLDDRV